MGKTGSIKHTHRYFKNQSGRWACMLDNCTHFMPQNMAPLPLGMNSVCWGCNEPFTLTHESMQRDRPMCEKCADEINKMQEYMKQRGI